MHTDTNTKEHDDDMMVLQNAFDDTRLQVIRCTVWAHKQTQGHKKMEMHGGAATADGCMNIGT